MSKDKDTEREPLSFWGTVGANFVAGMIGSAVVTLIFLPIAGAVVARRMPATREPMQL